MELLSIGKEVKEQESLKNKMIKILESTLKQYEDN
jgi:hypothetical protein